MTLPAYPVPALDEASSWRRLHPLSPLVRAGRGLIALLVVLAPALVGRGGQSVSRWAGEAGVFGVLLVLGFISWLVTRWQVADGALWIETGLLRRSSQRYPLRQVQAIDVVETGLARLLGLAELRLRMGGSGPGKGRLSCLRAQEARDLRTQLLAMGHGAAEPNGPGVMAPPERILFTLPTPRLLVSVMLSASGVLTIVLAAVLSVLAVINPTAVLAATGGSAAGIVAVLTLVWRRLNGDYATTVAEAADGLRLRSGLVQTTAETILIGRIQAVRLIEPVLWRPLHWCRLEVEVAGKRSREENQAEGRQLRAILPVGGHRQAHELLERIFPGAPSVGERPPRRARWKAPLSFRNLSWSRDEHWAVT
ncbi:MAG TPA: PH domain-containing protein, partial [Mycobacteriales bacterium]|nr:PH domain-containing protein [Mycobacteriales bacterium]